MGSGIAIEGHASDVTLSEIAGAVSITGEFFGTTHLEHINARSISTPAAPTFRSPGWTVRLRAFPTRT